MAAVTFDDGYQDVHDQAFPLLKRMGIPAAVFVVTDLVGTSRMQIHDLLYLLWARAAVKWSSAPQARTRLLSKLGISSSVPSDPHTAVEMLLGSMPQSQVLRIIEALEGEVSIEEDIRREHRTLSRQAIMEMHAAGITFGSHTHTHALLPNESSERVEKELRDSRETLESWLGERVRHFAFPCGQFNAATVRAVANAGYHYGYTICRHRDSNFPLLTMPRKLLWEKSCLDTLGSFSPSIMSCQVHGVFDLVSGCHLRHVSAAAA
jgi:peptidoglycan/xylan/chitin deacetylase (PgdA/CDA1 family)